MPDDCTLLCLLRDSQGISGWTFAESAGTGAAAADERDAPPMTDEEILAALQQGCDNAGAGDQEADRGKRPAWAWRSVKDTREWVGPEGVRMFEHKRLDHLHGGKTWSGAHPMADLLCSEPWRSMLRGRSVLELGSGTGLVGLCAGRLGGRVFLTEMYRDMVSALSASIDGNGLADTCRAELYAWGETLEPEHPLARAAPFDVVLAAECLYSDQGAHELCRALADLARPRGGLVLVSGTERWSTAACWQVVEAHGWTRREVASVPRAAHQERMWVAVLSARGG